MTERKDEEIKKFVRDFYGSIAQSKGGSCCSSGCCGPSAELSRARELYSEEELDALSLDINSLGCGNPVATAAMKPGDVVLDLGSGAGLDCFLASQQVGPQGKVIGLDMTPEMLHQARANAKKLSLENVEFRLGEMEHMPVDSNSVDVVISNCVINLSPNKDSVFREIFRVLKPGGRLCVSDMVTHGELPEEIREDPTFWAGCIAGALDEEVYLDKIRAAGFAEPEVMNSVSSSCCDEPDCCGESPIASVIVKARKPQPPRL